MCMRTGIRDGVGEVLAAGIKILNTHIPIPALWHKDSCVLALYDQSCEENICGRVGKGDCLPRTGLPVIS